MRHDASTARCAGETMPQTLRQSTAAPAFMVPGAVAGRVRAEQRVSTAWAMPSRLETWLRVTRAASPLGPLVSLQASLVIPGLQASATLYHGPAPGGDRPACEIVRIPMVPPGERITRAGHLMRGMSRGAALRWVVSDADGRPIADEREIGTCEDGFYDLSATPCLVDASAIAWISGIDGSPHRGARVRVSGELVFARGVTLRLGFHPRHAGADAGGAGACELPLVRAGFALYAPEKTLEGSGPASAWVSLRFDDRQGRPIGEEHVIGRRVPEHA